MSGSSLFIDTNIVLYLLNGDRTVADIIDGKTIYLSFISELELPGYSELTDEDRAHIESLLEQCIIIELNQAIKRLPIEFRRENRVKLPDAIIAATATHLSVPLTSADKGFSKLGGLQFIQYDAEG